jgi:hypothetical protein
MRLRFHVMLFVCATAVTAMDEQMRANAADMPTVKGVEKTEAKGKRISFGGYWWDEYPDGTLKWCKECNGVYPAKGLDSRGVASPVVNQVPQYRYLDLRTGQYFYSEVPYPSSTQSFSLPPCASGNCYRR